MKAHYRKLNDRSCNSSTYHKKDGTNVRAKLRQEAEKDVEAAKSVIASNKESAEQYVDFWK